MYFEVNNEWERKKKKKKRIPDKKDSACVLKSQPNVSDINSRRLNILGGGWFSKENDVNGFDCQ